MHKLIQLISMTGAILSGLAFGAVKTYQVTGPVLEVNDQTIVLQKGKDKWEISRDAATKIDGELKVGSKVTIGYKMVAADIEVKKEKK